jgi:hypothetical protein
MNDGGWGRECLRLLVHGPPGEYIIYARPFVGRGCTRGCRTLYKPDAKGAAPKIVLPAILSATRRLTRTQANQLDCTAVLCRSTPVVLGRIVGAARSWNAESTHFPKAGNADGIG